MHALTTTPRFAASASLVLMILGSIVTGADNPVIRGDTIELRDDRDRVLWRVVLPEVVRGGLQPVQNGWRVNQNLVIDRFGRVHSHSQPQSGTTPAAISNGAWDPVTTVIADGSVSFMSRPVFTNDGDVVFLAYSSDPDRLVAVRSNGNTNSWEAPVPIDADWFQGKLIADDLGNLTYVFRDYNQVTPQFETLSAVRYTPEGGWQERVVIGKVPTFFQAVAGAADRDGNLVIAVGDFGPIYTATYDISSDSWSRLNVLTTKGGQPTMAQSPSREQVAIVYEKAHRELLVRRFRFDTGWAPEVKIPGSELSRAFGGPFDEIPITIDNTGNITTYWEAQVVFLKLIPQLRLAFFAVYGSYIPVSGPEAPHEFLPWERLGATSLYAWPAYGQGPSGSAIALVTRGVGNGSIGFHSLYHDVQDGWETTQNPFSYAGAGTSQYQLVWRSDETALAVVNDYSSQNLTTLFFSNKHWEAERTLLPAEVDPLRFELASNGLDVVLLSNPLGDVNSTWYRAPAQSLRGQH